jgi:HEPN domain-containing protein
MKPPRLWEVLLRKAEQDEYVVDRLIALSDSPDEVIGFHLQQAAEKLLKAALGVRGIPYRRTHNLGELIQCATIDVQGISGCSERKSTLSRRAASPMISNSRSTADRIWRFCAYRTKSSPAM